VKREGGSDGTNGSAVTTSPGADGGADAAAPVVSDPVSMAIGRSGGVTVIVDDVDDMAPGTGPDVPTPVRPVAGASGSSAGGGVGGRSDAAGSTAPAGDDVAMPSTPAGGLGGDRMERSVFEELGVPAPDLADVLLPPRNRVTLFDVETTRYERQPWEDSQANLSSWFNYGLTPSTWRVYAARQQRVRKELQTRMEVHSAMGHVFDPAAEAARSAMAAGGVGRGGPMMGGFMPRGMPFGMVRPMMRPPMWGGGMVMGPMGPMPMGPMGMGPMGMGMGPMGPMAMGMPMGMGPMGPMGMGMGPMGPMGMVPMGGPIPPRLGGSGGGGVGVGGSAGVGEESAAPPGVAGPVPSR